MTPGNFNWFLHSMLFYYARHVIEVQRQKANKKDHEGSTEDEDSDEEDDN